MKNNNGNVPIKRHADKLNAKSKAHQVILMDVQRRVYTVVSGSSGMRYQVVMFEPSYGGGHCTCDWASKRPLAVQENGGRVGCSHVLAVEAFIAKGEGREVKAWDNEQQAARQKKKQEDVGDGLVVTTTKVKSKRRVQADFFGLLK